MYPRVDVSPVSSTHELMYCQPQFYIDPCRVLGIFILTEGVSIVKVGLVWEEKQGLSPEDGILPVGCLFGDDWGTRIIFKRKRGKKIDLSGYLVEKINDLWHITCCSQKSAY
jgi:hypothetical protein